MARVVKNLQFPPIPDKFDETTRDYLIELERMLIQAFLGAQHSENMGDVNNTNVYIESTNIIREAFCSTAATAGTGTSVLCYLDTDNTGTSITVECPIANGTTLGEAIPRLKDGTPVRVFKSNIDDSWKSVITFQATTACV